MKKIVCLFALYMSHLYKVSTFYVHEWAYAIDCFPFLSSVYPKNINIANHKRGVDVYRDTVAFTMVWLITKWLTLTMLDLN